MNEQTRSLPAPPAGLLSQLNPRSRQQITHLEPPVPIRHCTGTTVPVTLLLLGLAMAGVAERERIALIVPQTAPFFASIGLPVSDGLSLGEIETSLSDEGPTKVLTLRGHITNRQSTEAIAPNLLIVVRDESAQTLYTWTAPAPRTQLAPGEVVDFRSRLVSPPLNGHDVVVRFADRSDGMTATSDKR